MHTKHSTGGQPDKAGGSTYCAFEIGQHVVCVRRDDTPPGVVVIDKPIIPEIGRVYTVSSVSVSEVRETDDVVCLTLQEIPEQTLRFLYYGQPFTGRVIFNARCFRPLQKLTPEQFMLTDAPTDLVPA